jgi:hypothetical protein
MPSRTRTLGCVRRSTFIVFALTFLSVTAMLALAVAHGYWSYRFERPAFHYLGHPPFYFEPPSSIAAWSHVADVLAAPTIGAVLLVALVFGGIRRAFLRVAVYAGFAAAAFLISEKIAKPLVHQMYHGQLSFPSGNVTAVCATALAMWIALYPLLGRWARGITFVLSGTWVLLMGVAVVGARWHVPIDAVGSVLLSVGIVTAGAAAFDPALTPGPAVGDNLARVGSASSQPRSTGLDESERVGSLSSSASSAGEGSEGF